MSKWKCRECGSHDVQISLPTWYYEGRDHSLQFVDIDSESDPMYWYCVTCEEGGRGFPDRVTEDDVAMIRLPTHEQLMDFMTQFPGEEGA